MLVDRPEHMAHGKVHCQCLEQLSSASFCQTKFITASAQSGCKTIKLLLCSDNLFNYLAFYVHVTGAARSKHQMLEDPEENIKLA